MLELKLTYGYSIKVPAEYIQGVTVHQRSGDGIATAVDGNTFAVTDAESLMFGWRLAKGQTVFATISDNDFSSLTKVMDEDESYDVKLTKKK